MNKYVILLLTTCISMSCNSQESKRKEEVENKVEVTNEAPKGSWNVHREFDPAGNLIRYDSIYSWSSGADLNQLTTLDRDSIIKSMQSKFYRNFSHFDFGDGRFESFFDEDSLFSKRFFNEDFFDSDFGKDFMDINKIHERMENMQKQFMDRYQPLIDPKKEKIQENQK